LKRRKFIKHGLLATAGVSLLPRFISRGEQLYGWEPEIELKSKPVPSEWKDDEINIAWIGHATILINFYGKIILTDPTFFEGVGLYISGFILGPRRATLPALTIDEIPQPDIVLISHAHMDHMDYKTLKEFTEMYPGKLDCITAFNTKDVIDDLQWKSLREMDWLEELNLNGVKLKALEVKHRGARYPGEKDRANGFVKDGRSYNAYILERSGKKILFGGDTTFMDKFKQHKNEAVDIAIIPIGGYNPMRSQHCTPEEALVMAEYHLGAKYFIPMHCKTFDSGKDLLEPLEWMKRSEKHYTMKIGLRDIGETFTLKT
jgi:L-ascorbate metabolism protein UlaG (beta-lactamase superfamily)